MKVMGSPMNSVVATVASILMACALASALLSATVLPEPIWFCRAMAPVRARIASSKVDLPLAKGPTMATHFGPVRLPPARFHDLASTSSFPLKRRPRPVYVWPISGRRRLLALRQSPKTIEAWPATGQGHSRMSTTWRVGGLSRFVTWT